MDEKLIKFSPRLGANSEENPKKKKERNLSPLFSLTNNNFLWLGISNERLVIIRWSFCLNIVNTNVCTKPQNQVNLMSRSHSNHCRNPFVCVPRSADDEPRIELRSLNNFAQMLSIELDAPFRELPSG